MKAAGLSLGLGVISFGLALAPVGGIIPVLVCVGAGMVAGLGALARSRRLGGRWDGWAAAGVACNMAGLAVAVVLRWLVPLVVGWWLELVVRFLDWLISPLRSVPGF